MDITTATLGFVGLGAAAVIAIVLAWARRRVTATRSVARSPLTGGPTSRRSTDWFAGDPVLFTGGDAVAADCGTGGDGGGAGGCD